jgi:uncharacterized repeat protein (TIGR03803 family)
MRWEQGLIGLGILLGLTTHATAAYTLTTLASFNNNDLSNSGVEPGGVPALDSDGNLYGTTDVGGQFGRGTVFMFSTRTHAMTTLWNFEGSNAGNEVNPGLTIDANGNLYGTTVQAGSGAVESIYKIAAGTHEFSTLATFSSPNGQTPFGGVTIGADGNLFGTTRAGGTSNLGTVFEYNVNTQTLTTLASFNGANGANPLSRLVADSNGNLYGITSTGGSSNTGTLFKVSADTHTLTTPVNFTSTTGAPANQLTIDDAGNIYGMAYQSLFRFSTHTSSLTQVATFFAGSGQLVLDEGGNIFGTNLAGTFGKGTVLELPFGAQALTTLATFNGTNGDTPVGLVADGGGNLYGLTNRGGAYGTAFGGWGTVFEVAVPEPMTITGSVAVCTFALARRRRPARSPKRTLR